MWAFIEQMCTFPHFLIFRNCLRAPPEIFSWDNIIDSGSSALCSTVATVTVCCCDLVRFVVAKCARLTRNMQFVALPQVDKS